MSPGDDNLKTLSSIIMIIMANDDNHVNYDDIHVNYVDNHVNCDDDHANYDDNHDDD